MFRTYPTANLVVTVLGLLVLLPSGAATAVAQQTAADSSRIIKAYNPRTLQKQLDEAASAGYRISRAFAARGVLNPVADIFLAGHGATSGPVVTLERIPTGSANYEYAVVKFPRTLSGWEHDINKAGARGFRVVPGNTITVSQGLILGTMDFPMSIMEKAPAVPADSAAPLYAVVSSRGMSGFERDVNEHLADGYGVIWLGHLQALKVALMEKSGSAPVEARLLGADKDNDLQQRLREAAGEHFCIVDSMTRVEAGRHTYRIVYLNKCETVPEYTFVSNKQGNKLGVLTDFDNAVADGYRLLPPGVFGETITLVKAPPGKHYEYRFLEDNGGADEARKEGFAELHLSDPIWLRGHGFVIVFEREVVTASN